MFNTKMSVRRRTFLRGVGTTLALPLLDAMIPANTALADTPAKPVRRFGAVYVPHGKMMADWTPRSIGDNFKFSPILEPLEPLRDHLTVLSGLSGPPTVVNGGHAVAPASYLSGNIAPRPTEGDDIYAAQTFDQLLAKEIGQATPFPSLEVATEDFSTSIGACDTGYSCTYMNTISWANPTTPLPMETNPRVVFERMFRGTGSAAQRMARMREDRSILDSVTAAAASFGSGLGARDRARLTDYLENVREIERRIQRAEKQTDSQSMQIDAPIGVPEQYDEHVAILFDLLAVAWQTDTTRIFTFMMARDVSNISFPQIGVPDPHHALSHEANRNDPAKAIKFAKVNTYHVQMLGKFLENLQATQDGDGTLLDHSMVLYGSGMSNGNQHSHHPLPLLLAGKGAGQLKGNQHLVFPDLTPTANLLLSLAHKNGLEIESFGKSTSPLEV
jgi:hypothetical protein